MSIANKKTWSHIKVSNSRIYLVTRLPPTASVQEKEEGHQGVDRPMEQVGQHISQDCLAGKGMEKAGKGESDLMVYEGGGEVEMRKRIS